MTIDELVELTPEQRKAWRKIESGVKAFKKAGGQFYTVLESVHGYNGTYVDTIDGGERGEGISTNDAYMPIIFDAGLAGFSDDSRFIHLNAQGEALLKGDE
ncbi:Uncharacterised protein [Serratia ficaria]|uniref:hypothetical protein n=1 Tax=Serratia ficaria TaxID=61651 RepID=UPI00217910AB|nr:hypothetical protein [Serratia ficaria]CAI1103887.1 Uncharacterised protein [Serratia ficaria]CAI1941352.1 Uncharacterised protein [Serratia ficaria]CAI2465517.1 Uncharacterised protein [Serratia ficaria]